MSKLAVFDYYGLFIRFLEEGETTSNEGWVAEVGENLYSDPNTPVVLIEQPTPEGGKEKVAVYSGADYVRLYKDKVRDLIKITASELINESDWRVERAKERDLIGITDGETSEEVYAYREAVRKVSNQLESELLGNIQYEWDIHITENLQDFIENIFEGKVKEALQYIKVNRITPLAFFSRFTPEEQGAVMTAVQQNPILNALIVSLQLADGVVLTDPRIVAGIQALEQAGLLAEGRAQEILSIE